MRILFLSELFHPHGSGAELATFLYADQLSKMGCDVTVVTNRFEGEPEVSTNGSLKVYRLPLLGKAAATKYVILKRFDILISRFLGKLVERSDVIYIPRFWFSAVPLAKSRGKPVVMHLHDYIPVCPLSTLYDESEGNANCRRRLACSAKCICSFERSHAQRTKKLTASMLLNLTIGRVLPKMTRLSDAVFCVSNVQKRLIIEREPSIQGKTHVLYNPFPHVEDRETVGDAFGYFGGPDYLKGFCVLARALAYRKAMGLRQVKIHATKLQVPDLNVSAPLRELGFIMHGKLGDAEFKSLYNQVGTVLVPSIWNEPWPYVVVEALIHRRLVIASRIGGIPEQAEGCSGVFFCEPGDSHQLATSIDRVSELKEDEVEEYGWQNREAFLRRFHSESSIRKFINICDHLI